MKVTVDHKDLDRILDLLPSFNHITGEDREALMRLVSAASRGMRPPKHAIYVHMDVDGANKIAAIKFVRALFGHDLKAAKDAVEAYGEPVGTLFGDLDRAHALGREYGVRFTYKTAQ